MDAICIAALSDIIKREKVTNNVLFTLKSKGYGLAKVALLHSNYLYNLLKLFSTTGFNIELEEPQYVNCLDNDIVRICADDLKRYSRYIKLNYAELTPIICELLEIKAMILENLLLSEKENAV